VVKSVEELGLGKVEDGGVGGFQFFDATDWGLKAEKQSGRPHGFFAELVYQFSSASAYPARLDASEQPPA